MKRRLHRPPTSKRDARTVAPRPFANAERELVHLKIRTTAIRTTLDKVRLDSPSLVDADLLRQSAAQARKLSDAAAKLAAWAYRRASTWTDADEQEARPLRRRPVLRVINAPPAAPEAEG